MTKKRAIIMVIDSMGIGALPDAADYGDDMTCNTICNLARAAGGLNAPNLEKMGLGNLAEILGVSPCKNPIAQFGIMEMMSKGKDTTTGHWEIAGLVLEKPFRTYKKFPDELINAFIEETGCKGVYGNIPASGTKIIEEFNELHTKNKFPIVYTSADSVFQIAVNIDVIPLETLYEWCKIARRLLDEGDYRVSRVIARPYHIENGKPVRIGKFRHDYSVPPPRDTLLNEIENKGGKVYGIGKIKDIFVGSGISKSTPTGSNKEGLEATLEAIKNDDCDLIFTNLVDTDMLFGHRRDFVGYKNAIEEIDGFLPKILAALKENDMFLITADHGCDPTFKGTDHTREQVPLLVYGKKIKPKALNKQESYVYVADCVRNWLFEK